MSMKFEIEAALMAHSAWRKRFRDYLNGKASFDIKAAGDSHQCQFGNWLDNEGHRLMPQERQGDIRAAHDEFHRIATEIIQKITEKRFAEARADIASDGALNRASSRLSELLLKASLHEPTARGAPQATESAQVSQGSEKPPEPSPTTEPTPDKTPE
jgi:hypothetical protein